MTKPSEVLPESPMNIRAWRKIEKQKRGGSASDAPGQSRAQRPDQARRKNREAQCDDSSNCRRQAIRAIQEIKWFTKAATNTHVAIQLTAPDAGQRETPSGAPEKSCSGKLNDKAQPGTCGVNIIENSDGAEDGQRGKKRNRPMFRGAHRQGRSSRDSQRQCDSSQPRHRA